MSRRPGLCALGRGSRCRLPAPQWRQRGGLERRPAARARRHPRPGRRVRLRQEHHGARGDRVSQPGSDHPRWALHARRHRSARPPGQGAPLGLGASGRIHRPERRPGAQPRTLDRRPARGAAAGAPRPARRRGPRAFTRAAALGRASRAGGSPAPLPPRVQRRPAAAHRHRARARLQPGRPGARRADDGTRCHDPGPYLRPHPQDRGRHARGCALRQPRSRAAQRARPSPDRDVRRPGGGERPARHGAQEHAAPLHPGPARGTALGARAT